MLIAEGTIIDCMDDDAKSGVTAKAKITYPKEFIHKPCGNHHVMVYGDYRGQLRMLDDILGMATIEV